MHTYAHKQWHKKGETLGAAACELRLILIVFLETRRSAVSLQEGASKLCQLLVQGCTRREAAVLVGEYINSSGLISLKYS